MVRNVAEVLIAKVSRQVFFRTALLASTGAICGAGAASALTLDSEPSTGLVALYHAAKASCGNNPYHRELLAEADAMLGNEPLSEEEHRQLLASVTCPICGCAVLTANDLPSENIPAGEGS